MWLRRITTSVGSGPASGCTPGVICMVLRSASTVRRQVFLGLPLLRFPSGVQWRAVRVMLSCSLLMTCPIHFHRLRMMMGSPCCLDCIERVAVDWRWCQAKGCAGFSWGSLCGRLTAWWCCSLSSCGIQSVIVGGNRTAFVDLQLSLGAVLWGPPHVVETVLDVTPCSSIMPYCSAQLNELFSCWQVFCFHLDWLRIGRVKQHHFFLLFADL